VVNHTVCDYWSMAQLWQKYIYDILLVYIGNTRQSHRQSHVYEIHNHNNLNLDQKASHCMIQIGEARNNGNAITNGYRTPRRCELTRLTKHDPRCCPLTISRVLVTVQQVKALCVDSEWVHSSLSCQGIVPSVDSLHSKDKGWDPLSMLWALGLSHIGSGYIYSNN